MDQIHWEKIPSNKTVIYNLHQFQNQTGLHGIPRWVLGATSAADCPWSHGHRMECRLWWDERVAINGTAWTINVNSVYCLENQALTVSLRRVFNRVYCWIRRPLKLNKDPSIHDNPKLQTLATLLTTDLMISPTLKHKNNSRQYAFGVIIYFIGISFSQKISLHYGQVFVAFELLLPVHRAEVHVKLSSAIFSAA